MRSLPNRPAALDNFRSWRMLGALTATLLAPGLASVAPAQAPLQPGISYQGHLEKNGVAYDGVADLNFRLYDSEATGTQIGGTQSLVGVAIDDGTFHVALDFGAGVFAGDARWIEIAAKTTGDADFVTLAPRQAVRPAPYAVYALDGPAADGLWEQDGTGVYYPGGGVGVTGGTTFTQGNGVFLDGGYGTGTFAHVFAFDYDTYTPLDLLLNFPGGDVGIGAAAPEAKLHVVGEKFGIKANAYGGAGGLTSTAVWGVGDGSVFSGPAVGVYGQSDYGDGVQGVTSSSVWYGGYFHNSAGGVALYADGPAQVKTLQILGGADIVEGFETGEETIEPGTVVVIDADHPGELRASSRAYDRRVAGIVSGAGGIAPGLRLGQEGVMDGDTPVAMSGRVYVRCSAENGAIRPGDLLTTAATQGHAMRSDDTPRSHGAVLGKAMSSLDRGTGLVLVLVNLQ